MRMLRVLSLPFILLLSVLALAQAPAPTAANADLGGLWKAKRISGGLTHLRLIVSRSGDAYRADMLGWNLAMRSEGSTLSFSLPNGQGSFRGRRENDGSIVGHWLHPGGASPVALGSDGSGRWSGFVTTAPDELTFFLHLRPESANSWIVGFSRQVWRI